MFSEQQGVSNFDLSITIKGFFIFWETYVSDNIRDRILTAQFTGTRWLQIKIFTRDGLNKQISKNI